MSNLKQVSIYTRGITTASGAGGYGAILLYENHPKELCGGFQLSTNNRMDLVAIEGLKALKTRCKVTLYNNNRYLISHIKCKRYEYVNHWRCSIFPVLKWSSHFPWLCSNYNTDFNNLIIY
jgi:ribonuclease HI